LKPMMHGTEKSDLPIIPKKRTNKAGKPVAESVEGRGGNKRNAELQSTARTQSREAVSQAQGRIREAVARNRGEKLTALLHHISVDCLRWSYYELKRTAATGIDGVTWRDYGGGLEENLADLHRQIHMGAYRAQPSRRKYIPKANGQQRPLGIAALEDKIVQRAMVEILTPIYEAEFLGFSYGFRSGRSQHDALDALAYGIKVKKIKWVLDADISRFFDTISHEWMVRFLEHRIGDKRVVRLIIKWLKAGVLEDGAQIKAEEGTPQGAVISPLLANIYLHYVYDLWAKQWRNKHCKGDMIVIRFTDDSVAGFQNKKEGERFLADLRERLAKFALTLHPEKTRLIEFGRFAALERQKRGQGRPETFDFLGFTHICGEKVGGRGFQLWRKTKRGSLKAKIKEVKEELRRRMHASIKEQGEWLNSVLRGHYAYFAVPTNSRALSAFRYHVVIRWMKSLRRRSQRHRMIWERMSIYIDQYLPSPKILHPWPEQRFCVKYSS
jgi:RNA-directed DNA polymerase